MNNQQRILLLLAISIILIVITCLFNPVPQDPSYHLFADARPWLGVPNFLDVVTNLPFIFIGAFGLLLLKRSNAGIVKYAYGCMFLGFILSGLGSGYYHYTPNNTTLVYDRIPMTIVFMSFVSLTISEYINKQWGKVLLMPLLLAGITSVLWWKFTEGQGRGDLRFYAFVQFYPVLLVPMIYLLFPSKEFKKGRALLIWVVLWYIVAKLFEHFDREIFALTSFISGHSLKHLAASVSCYYLVAMFRKNYAT